MPTGNNTPFSNCLQTQKYQEKYLIVTQGLGLSSKPRIHDKKKKNRRFSLEFMWRYERNSSIVTSLNSLAHNVQFNIAKFLFHPIKNPRREVENRRRKKVS